MSEFQPIVAPGGLAFGAWHSPRRSVPRPPDAERRSALTPLSFAEFLAVMMGGEEEKEKKFVGE